MLFVHLQRTLQVVGDVVIAQRGAGQAARLAGPAPVQLADLEDAVVATVVVLGGGVETRLVVSDAHPGRNMVGAHAQRQQLARQLAALVHARSGQREQRARQPCDAIHRSVRLTVLRTRTLFYVYTERPPAARVARYVCRARILA